MFKILGCILIIGASSALGFKFAETLKSRVIQLKSLQAALIQLQNEIFFTRTALPEACLKVAEKTKKPINRIFEQVADSLNTNKSDSVFEAFQSALEELKNSIALSNEDKEMLLDLAKSIGDSDIEGHKKVFGLTDFNLKNRIELLEKQMDKNMKMYKYLGVSLGAVIAILLI